MQEKARQQRPLSKAAHRRVLLHTPHPTPRCTPTAAHLQPTAPAAPVLFFCATSAASASRCALMASSCFTCSCLQPWRAGRHAVRAGAAPTTSARAAGPPSLQALPRAPEPRGTCEHPKHARRAAAAPSTHDPPVRDLVPQAVEHQLVRVGAHRRQLLLHRRGVGPELFLGDQRNLHDRAAGRASVATANRQGAPTGGEGCWVFSASGCGRPDEARAPLPRAWGWKAGAQLLSAHHLSGCNHMAAPSYTNSPQPPTAPPARR